MSQTILLTGANGRVSRFLRPRLLEKYGSLIVSSRREMHHLSPGETYRQAALDDPDALQAACEGVDGVIHMGGQSGEAP